MFLTIYTNGVVQWSKTMDYKSSINGITVAAIVGVIDVEKKLMLRGRKSEKGIDVAWAHITEMTDISQEEIDKLNTPLEPTE
jgi:hypothetical protein